MEHVGMSMKHSRTLKSSSAQRHKATSFDYSQILVVLETSILEVVQRCGKKGSILVSHLTSTLVGQAFLGLSFLLACVVWMSIFWMEVLPLIKDMSPSSLPPPMPLVVAPHLIAFPHGPHAIVFNFSFIFPCVILTFVSISSH